jgi:short-subunit dehydrogenase
MTRRGGGRIVNIASVGGLVSIPHALSYCASKFALVGLSRGLRSDLIDRGIYVTTVCPGLMRTGSARQALFKSKHRAEYAWFAIGSSLPAISMSADRAARQIVTACQEGRAELQLSVPTRVAAVGAALCPELTAELLAAANRLFPEYGGIGQAQVRGYESESPWSQSPLTALGRRAAWENNEMGGSSNGN